MRIVLRKALEGDLKAINDLTDEMHRYLAGLYGLELSPGEVEGEHFDVDELGNVYVAEVIDLGVVGYISFSPAWDEWVGQHYELEHLVVCEDLRGSGVAEMLFSILLERAKIEGVNITAGTLLRNERALRFYRRLGFKPLTVGLLLDINKRIPDL